MDQFGGLFGALQRTSIDSIEDDISQCHCNLWGSVATLFGQNRFVGATLDFLLGVVGALSMADDDDTSSQGFILQLLATALLKPMKMPG